MQLLLCRRPTVAAFLGLCATAGSAVAQGRAPTTNSTRTDARLETKVRSIQIGGSVSDYLELLTDSTQVQHRVIPTYADRPLVALRTDMALGKLHRAISRNYQLSWRASAGSIPSYLLYEDSDDRRTRAVALASMKRKGQERMAARLQKVRHMASLGPEGLARLKNSESGMVRSLLHPRGSALHHLMFGLPEKTWAQLWATGTARIRVSDLAPQLQAHAKAAAGNDRAGREGGESYRIADLVVPEGRIKLQIGGTLDNPTIWSVMQYGPHGTHTNLLYAEAATRQPPEHRREHARLHHSKVPLDSRFHQKITLRDHPRPKNIHLERGERPPNARPLAEYLQQLEKQVALPIVAECEHKPKDASWLRQQWWLAADIVERPLSEALDLLCADFEFEWQFREGTLLLRPKRWFVPPDQRGYVYPKQDPPQKNAPPT